MNDLNDNLNRDVDSDSNEAESIKTSNARKSAKARRLARRWGRTPAKGTAFNAADQAVGSQNRDADSASSTSISNSNVPRASLDSQQNSNSDSIASADPISEAISRALSPIPQEVSDRDASKHTSDSAAPDATSLSAGDYPWSQASFDLSGARGSTFQAIFSSDAIEAIHLHAASSPEVEVCGVLVGDIFRDASGPFVHVQASIRGTHAASHAANVTFTAETWQHIQAEMDRHHSERKIVGWYHSHPDFGIFLSQMDLFIHENFFNLPWQIAFVCDPIGREDGAFVWRDGKAVREEFLIDAAPPAHSDVSQDVPAVAALDDVRYPGGEDHFTSLQTQSQTTAALLELAARLGRMEKRQKTFAFAVACLVLILLAWPIVLTSLLSDRGPSSRLLHRGDTAIDHTDGRTAGDHGPTPASAGSAMHVVSDNAVSNRTTSRAAAVIAAADRTAAAALVSVQHAQHPSAQLASARKSPISALSQMPATSPAMAPDNLPAGATPTRAAVETAHPQLASAAHAQNSASVASNRGDAHPGMRADTMTYSRNLPTDDDSSDDIQVDPNGQGGAKIIEISP